MLLCECPYWTHEACLAKSVFETCRCPTCQTSVDLLDDKISIAPEAADGLMGRQEGACVVEEMKLVPEAFGGAGHTHEFTSMLESLLREGFFYDQL